MKFTKTFLTLGLLISTISYANPVYQGHAVLIIKKDKLKEFKVAVSKIIKPTRKEKSCITYYGYQVLDDQGHETNRFEFHEIWKTKETMLIDHKENSPHMKLFFKEVKMGEPDSYVESFDVQGKYVQLIND